MKIKTIENYSWMEICIEIRSMEDPKLGTDRLQQESLYINNFDLNKN